MIRRTCITLIGLIFFLGFVPQSLFAQLVLSLEVNFQTFLQYEPVFVRLTIKNMSAHPLPFSKEGKLVSTFRLDVEDNERHLLRFDKNQINPLCGFILQPAVIHQVIIPLSLYVDIRKAGNYAAKAIVSHPMLPQKYESNQVHFTVSKGIPFWKRSVGVPVFGDYSVDKIQTRTVSLVSMFDGKEKAYYFKIESDDEIISIARVGYEIDTTRLPSCLVDKISQTHLLINMSQKIYAYFIYDIDGRRVKREIIAVDRNNPPSLFVDNLDGTVSCKGGRPAREDEYKSVTDQAFQGGEAQAPLHPDAIDSKEKNKNGSSDILLEDKSTTPLPPEKKEMPKLIPFDVKEISSPGKVR